MRGRGERRRVAEVQRRGRLRRTGGGRGEDQEERGASKRERGGSEREGGQGKGSEMRGYYDFFWPGDKKHRFKERQPARKAAR